MTRLLLVMSILGRLKHVDNCSIIKSLDIFPITSVTLRSRSPYREFTLICPMYTRKSVSWSVSLMQYACTSATRAYPCVFIHSTQPWSLRRAISAAKFNKYCEHLFHILSRIFFELAITTTRGTLFSDISVSSWPYSSWLSRPMIAPSGAGHCPM